MVVCKFFLQGTCKFGSYCHFEHQVPSEYKKHVLQSKTVNCKIFSQLQLYEFHRQLTAIGFDIAATQFRKCQCPKRQSSRHRRRQYAGEVRGG